MLNHNKRTKLLSGSALASMALCANAHANSFEITDPTAFNTVNVEDIINTLPQFQPAFDSSSNNPGNGASTIDLRGLGTQRNLVLIDGLRIANFGVGNTVDLNAIPASLIERIDILTGEGAVAYGEGAVGGVINLILKDDFEGLSLDTSYELSAQEWDAGLFNVALTAGKSFLGGRGHAMLSASYTNRNSVLQGSRDFSSNVFFDPGAGGSEFIPGGSTNIPGTRFRGLTSSNFGLTTSQVEAIDPNCVNNFCSGLFIDEAGNTRGLRFGPFGSGTDQTTDLYNYAAPNFLQLPQERFNIAGSASFEIAPFAELYLRGLYAQNDTAIQLAPQSTGTLPLNINLDNPFLASNPQLLSIITTDFNSNNGDGTATVRVNRRLEELGNRTSEFDYQQIQFATGFRGDIGKHLSYDAYFNYGRSETRQVDRGDFSIPALQDALLCDGGPTAIASGCTDPAANIFGGPGSLSQEAASFISRTSDSGSDSDILQTGLKLSLNSGSNISPWSSVPAIATVGFEYREVSVEEIDFSVLGVDAIDFNTDFPIRGSQETYDFYGNAVIPLISQRPFVESLSVSGGFRWSDNSAFDNFLSYEAAADWIIGAGISIRADLQQSHSTPSFGSRFASQSDRFFAIIDPCAGGQFNPDPRDVIVQTCIDTGVPSINVGAGFTSGITPPTTVGGNPDLEPEEAFTFTVGGSYSPTFIDGLTLSADFFNIEVDDSAIELSGTTIINGCHFDGNADFCSRIMRDVNSGVLIRIDGTTANAATLVRRGLDLGLTFEKNGLTFGGNDFGSLKLDFIATRVFENSFEFPTAAANSSITRCEGLFSGTCGEPAPTYSHNLQVKHQIGSLTTNLRWRHIGGVDFDPLSGQSPSNLSDDINAFNYLDVEMQYSLTNNAAINLGVRNITGEEPPVLGSTFSEQANTFPATYETLGRQVFAGVSVKF